MLPTRANYTDYSCESCMAELYNYKDSVRVIMCWRKRRKKNTYLMEILVLQATAPLGDFQPCVVHYHLYLHTVCLHRDILLARGFISFCLMQQSVVHWCLFFLDKSFIVSWGYMSTFFQHKLMKWSRFKRVVHLHCRSAADVFQWESFQLWFPETTEAEHNNRRTQPVSELLVCCPQTAGVQLASKLSSF